MKKDLLRELPSVDELLKSAVFKEASPLYPSALLKEAVRGCLDEIRGGIISGKRERVTSEDITAGVIEKVREYLRPSIKKVVNATGTILHTNLGRALLSPEAAEAVRLSALNHVNIELDLGTGERGDRDGHLEGLLKRLASAEASCVVNNNAAAVLIALNTLAEGKEVIISRGELIEIGGSFRLPEIIKKSGCVLREVGTTNRTHPKDYGAAINADTALIFKAHKSNYFMEGFTSEVGLKELVEIGRKHGIPVVEDLGSGSLLDLGVYGLPHEPVVRERVETGADVVTFSGDKLLGGPQAGLIVGKKEIIAKIKSNPLKRALRADKMTLSALEATLKLYLDPERLAKRLPALKVMTKKLDEIERDADKAAALLRKALGEGYKVVVEDNESVIGGGSLPGHNLKTKAVAVTHKTLSPDRIYKLFLGNDPPVVGRVHKDKFLLDMRTVEKAEDVVPSLSLTIP